MQASGARAVAAAEAMRRAVASFQGGDFAEVERLCRAVLDTRSNHFDALHLLGLVAAQRGHFEGADKLLRQALRINPGSAEAHSNYGDVQKARGHFAEALGSYDRALAIR